MQSRATVKGIPPSRIYCISALTLGSHEDGRSIVAHAAEMQFDSILITDPISLNPTEQSASAEDDSDASQTSLLELFASDCKARGLRLLLDIEIYLFPAQHKLVLQNEKQFYSSAHVSSLPDPRFLRIGSQDPRVRLRLDAKGAELALDYWRGSLSQWVKLGASGFRCLGISDISPVIWRDLIHASHADDDAITFMAWTPGCAPQQLLAIRDCGFDAVFSSDAWWDYRGNWLAEENTRLSSLGRVIAAPEDPAGLSLIKKLQLEDSALAQRAYLRALQTAATIGDGVMVVRGFEHGLDMAHPNQTALFDLTAEITNANRIAEQIEQTNAAPSSFKLLSDPNADLVVLLRPKDTSTAIITIINVDLHRTNTITSQFMRERASGWTINFNEVTGESDQQVLTLQAGEVRHLLARMAKPILLQPAGGKAAVVRATRVPRIAIENVSPTVDAGRFPVKKIAGSLIEVEADIFSDGHDHLAACVWWRASDEKEWHAVAMQEVGNDRWRASVPLTRLGRHLFYVEAWRDSFDTYRDELNKKTVADRDVALEVQEGRQLVERVTAGQPEDSAHTVALKKLLKQLPAKSKKKPAADLGESIALLLSPETASLMQASDLRDFSTRTEVDYKIDIERKAAEFSNWYELFPRSQSGDVHRHGNFDDVIARMPAVRDMGFDTLYFPPIHPIGRKNMKGKNNTLTPGPDDPGSPYAIGSEDGGHDAVHPELGTLDDFRRMMAAAKKNGLEIALDFAIQCSPDHPWLKQHPEWFAYRPDGSIRYAENPPKKYEDIVNVDFYADSEMGKAVPDLWMALRDVVLMWVREGVRVFRVDNPHTKPLPFWEWMIGDVRARAPDTIFLAEAFTRPKPMYRLAKVGFSQSYTYFTWRHTKEEFIEYLTELTADIPAGGPREFFRPHFFVNTPDINPYFLQRSGRAGFLIRSALAATLSGLWGVYSGFELCEAQAVTGKEEYLDSEKYEIRAWDWQRPGNIVREITLLNRIRNTNPALQTHFGVQFHTSSNEKMLYFSKSTKGKSEDRFGQNVILVAINLDPFAAHDANIELPLWQLGLPDHASVELEDLVNENRFTLHGKQQQIHLDPQQMPFAIWRVRSGTQ